MYRGKKHVLRGSGKQLETSSGRTIEKHSGNGSQRCMIQVIPVMCYILQCAAVET